ncbi:phosphoribosyl-AMP cyclohydrolase [Lacticaseibacillus paracasei subsp. paracasei Lpp126]|uniref:Histidine biosynthesis bifunctional protein HisIE n=1 Tax=Lacticaseibacillus paracasei subsp. paracasei Lpp126 TaxID=1256206 RepID=S2RDD8_LACPA|nr:phosphoribosyl-AMP cyclohydrolase [Lacticaseibacillus paracasei subsp. paracasei Lpp126]
MLMVAYMNQESLAKTMATGETWFWSRSRKTLWHKGATSGNIQTVKTIAVDCDADTLLVTVDPAGPACHTGHISCFYRHYPEGKDLT